MGSYNFMQHVSDNESSVGGGGGDCGSNSSLFAGVTVPPTPSSAAGPTTLFQCCECFCVFTSEAALIQHKLQTNLLCSLASFLERFKKSQQQARIPPSSSLPKRPYYDSHQQFQTASSPESQFLFLDNEEGSGTNDPFGDGNMTLDLVSPMDRDFVGTNFGYAAGNGNGRARSANGDQQELDLELKL